MVEAHPEVVFYWLPGCGNCTRLKGYLTARGVVHRAVNILSAPDALEAASGAGHRAAPFLLVGDRWVAGEEAAIDSALALAPAKAQAALPPHVLVERCARMLELASDLACQLPEANFDDPTPTMADVQAPQRFLADGRPFVAHSTSKSLVHHIAQHGEKAWRILLASDGVHELGFTIDGTPEYNFFGEPEAGTPMYRVAAKMRLAASDLNAWLRTDREGDGLARIVQTHRGPRTMLQYLKYQTVCLVQHCRQLVDILERLDIQPCNLVSSEDVAGLGMPAGLWE